jgi:hypothetical protein
MVRTHTSGSRMNATVEGHKLKLNANLESSLSHVCQRYRKGRFCTYMEAPGFRRAPRAAYHVVVSSAQNIRCQDRNFNEFQPAHHPTTGLRNTHVVSAGRQDSASRYPAAMVSGVRYAPTSKARYQTELSALSSCKVTMLSGIGLGGIPSHVDDTAP